MSITNFYANAVTNDFARLFQFRIIDWKDTLGTSIFSADELIYIESANLPGKAINNIPVPYMGLSFNVPGTISYPGSAGWNLAIRCDSKYAIRDKLENNLTNTFAAQSTSGAYDLPNTKSIITMDLYGKGYDNGSSPLVVRRYHFHGVYLVSLADTQYDVKDNGAISMINATVAYQYWTSSTAPAASTVDNTVNSGGPQFPFSQPTGEQF